MQFSSKKFITTNYDYLIEKSYKSHTGKYIGEGFVFTNENAKIDRAAVRKGTKNEYIYKYHGCISDPSSIVLAEEDYNKIIFNKQEVKNFIKNLFLYHPVIMIGFGLVDFDFDHFVAEINHLLDDDVEIYALVSAVTQRDIDHYKEKGIHLIPYDPIDDQHNGLNTFLDESFSEILSAQKAFKEHAKQYNDGGLDAAISVSNEHWASIDKSILGFVGTFKQIKKSDLYASLQKDDFTEDDISHRAETLVHAGLLLQSEHYYLSLEDAVAQEAADLIEDQLIVMLEQSHE